METINMYKVSICGHFGGNEKYFDGQTVKTKNIYNELIKLDKEGLIKIIENRPDGQGFGGVPYILYNNAKTNQDYRRLWNLLNGTF